MSRRSIALDEVGGLLHAAGGGDTDAFATLYDRTAPAVFGLLTRVLGESAAAERAMVRIYVRVWRTAPAFDAAVVSGGTFLMEAVHRELGGRGRRGRAECPHLRQLRGDGAASGTSNIRRST